jgi:secreted Zn-dependent insulinase-like peptidase
MAKSFHAEGISILVKSTLHPYETLKIVESNLKVPKKDAKISAKSKYYRFWNDEEHAGKIVKINNEKHFLTVYWNLPISLAEHEFGVGYYLAWILRLDTYKGSLAWFLKEKKWATNTICLSDWFQNEHFSLFGLNIHLEEEGLQNFEEIILLIGDFVSLLGSQEPSKLFFEFVQSKVVPMNALKDSLYTSLELINVAKNMGFEKLGLLKEEYLFDVNAPMKMKYFDPHRISAATKHLSLERAICVVRGVEVVDTNCKRSSVYGNVPYSVSTFSVAKNRNPNPYLFLPKPFFG